MSCSPHNTGKFLKKLHFSYIIKVLFFYNINDQFTYICLHTSFLSNSKCIENILFARRIGNKFQLHFTLFTKYLNLYSNECVFSFNLKSLLILLFSLFLLLYMGPTTLFGIIHRSHCTISTNFYLYL